MKIGQVAEQAGVSVDTVRYYERRGVVPPPQRRPSGYRDYPASTIERIRAARDLQRLGLTLDEIVGALRAHDAGGTTCEGELWRLEAVLDRIDAKIAELTATRHAIGSTIRQCRTGQCRFATSPEPDPPA